MLRSAFIATTPAKPQPFFRWPLSLYGRVTHTICVPGLRQRTLALFERTNGLSVQFTACQVYDFQRFLQGLVILLDQRDHVALTPATFRPSDLPSVRAALAIINPIVAALSGVEEKREAA